MHENRILKLTSHYGGKGNVLQNLEIAELIILPLKMIFYFTKIYFRRVFKKL